MDLERIFDRWTGSHFVGRLAVAVSAGRLRILAYHGIEDLAVFARQMEWLKENLTPVDAWEVIRWTQNGRLPRGAVWITFDDGDPSVISEGVPVLEQMMLPSTMFICPGLVDTDEPYWWQAVERSGMISAEVQRLKGLPDRERRRIVDQLKGRLETAEGGSWRRAQLSSGQIEKYLGANGTIGNHTWDHPCLHRCEPAEQVRQVTAAHEWIAARFPGQPPVFAYPNGNHTLAAEQTLRNLGYRLGVLFDHRLSSSNENSMALSRLRTDAGASIERFRSVVGGLHPQTHRLRMGISRALRGGGNDLRDRWS